MNATITPLLVPYEDLRKLGVPYVRSHLRTLEQKGLFPKRIKLSENRIAWRYDDIKNWVDQQAAQERTA